MTERTGIRPSILYVLAIPEGVASGIDAKVERQVEVWRSDRDVRVRRPDERWSKHALTRRAARLPLVIGAVWSAMRGGQDARTYVRWMPWSPGLITLLRLTASAIEVNSAFWVELDSRSFRLLDSLFGRKVLAAASLVICPTEEIALELRQRYQLHESNVVIVANGVPTYKRSASAPGRSHDRPRVVYLCGALDASWHGVDRLLAIARAAQSLEFVLVGGKGPGDLDDGRFGAVPPNVSFTGPRFGAELDQVLQSCDVGLGTLALERKRMQEACSLKVREYVANGLPVYLPHKDTDFSDQEWFVCFRPSIVNADTEFHAQEISKFAGKVRGQLVTAADLEGTFFIDKEARRLALIDSAPRSKQQKRTVLNRSRP